MKKLSRKIVFPIFAVIALAVTAIAAALVGAAAINPSLSARAEEANATNFADVRAGANAATSPIYWWIDGTALHISNTDGSDATVTQKGSFDYNAQFNAQLSPRPWADSITTITRVEVTGDISPTHMTGWFSGMTALEYADLSGLKYTSSMFQLFNGCTKLSGTVGADGTAVKLGSLYIDSGFNMSYAFSNCTGITAVDFSPFAAGGDFYLQSAMYSFSGCKALTSVNFGTAFKSNNYGGQTNFVGMFMNCTSLEAVDLTDFDFGKPEAKAEVGSMFSGCHLLKTVTFGETFNEGNVTSLVNTFYGCSSLTSLDLSKFDTSSVTNFNGTFYGCSSLTDITFGEKFTTASATTLSFMFYGCRSLTSVNISSFTINSGVSVSSTFDKCTKLATVNTPSSIADGVSIALPAACYWSKQDGTKVTALTSAETNDVLTKHAMHAFDNYTDNGDGTHTATCANGCGKKDTCGHAGGVWLHDDANTQHYQVCTDCGVEFARADHSGGMATCAEKARCVSCGQEYGETLAHIFDRQVMDDRYLKSPATCTAKAVYYYSCSQCSAASTDKTFEGGRALGHDLKDGACSYCGKKIVAVTNCYGDKVNHITFADAWSAACREYDSRLTLLCDVETPTTLEISSDMGLNLNLNGYCVKLTGESGSVFSVSGRLTIYDEQEEGCEYGNGSYRVTNPVTGEEATVTGGLITGGKGTTYADKGEIGGGVFVGNKDVLVGGKAVVTLYGGTIAGNTAKYGGGIGVVCGELEINSDKVKISYNTVGSATEKELIGGAGVYVLSHDTESQGVFKVQSGKAEISYNAPRGDSKAVHYGGGVFVDGDICTNRAVFEGGADIAYNRADYGGGVALTKGYWYYTDGTTLTNNQVTEAGGGAYVGYSQIIFSGTVRGNSAKDGGGMMIMQSSCDLKGDVVVTENVSSSGLGGGIMVASDPEASSVYDLYVAEGVKITGNKWDDGKRVKDSDLFLSSGIRLDQLLDTLTPNTKIGIMLEDGYETNYGKNVFFSGFDAPDTAPSEVFTSNDPTKCFKLLGGDLEVMLVAHESDKWLFDDANTQHYMICTNCNAEFGRAEHSKGTAATCTTKPVCGVCGKEYGQALGHIYDKTVAEDRYLKSEATCTDKAVYYYSCVCGEEGTETFEHGEALGHAFGDYADNGDGTHTATCTRGCGVTDTAAHVAAEAVHENEVAATCTAEGSYDEVVYCSVCNALISRTGESVAKLAHTEVTVAGKAATCTETGLTEGKKCSVCDTVTVAQTQIPALGHDFSGGFTVDTEPTCTQKGSKSKHCSRCDIKTEVTEINFAAHTLTHVAKKDATVEAEGNIEYWTCSVCQKKFSDNAGTGEITDVVIPKLVAVLVKPDENGGDNQVEVTNPDGFTPDIKLVVTEMEKDSKPVYETVAQTVSGEVGIVYDVTLKSNGVSVQPDGALTIKLLIPKNLLGKTFNIFHLHVDTVTEMEYTVEGKYAVVTTDKLSEFIFVGEKTAVAPVPENPPVAENPSVDLLWLILIIVASLLIVGEVGYLIYRKVRKK